MAGQYRSRDANTKVKNFLVKSGMAITVKNEERKQMKQDMLLTSLYENYFPDEWYEMATADHFWVQSRYQFFFRQLKRIQIPLNKPFKGLEIGHGNGIVSRQIESSTAWCIDGIDINEKALQRNHAGRGKTFFYNIHDRDPELKACYDIAILFDVLEHIKDTTSFLVSTLYHLKQGGWLFINVPALPLLWSHYDEVQNHCRRYNSSMLKREFEKVALQPIDMGYWGCTMIPLLLLRKWLIPKRGTTCFVMKYGFSPPNPLWNNILRNIMRVEAAIIKKPLAGTSLLAAAIKL